MNKKIDKIHAPYNFVPLSAWIYEPDWGPRVTQDVPFSDGINGVLDLEIEALTPILVGGRQVSGTREKEGEVHFYRTPDGKPAIPGSSIKGMCRNVLEIASFGKMRMVDDRRLSIRDLSPGVKEIYRCRISDKDLKPKAKAGFLRPSTKELDYGWEILPRAFARVDHNQLIHWAESLGIVNPGKIKERQNAASKYETWGQNLDVTFRLPDPRSTPSGKGTTPEWEKARDLGSINIPNSQRKSGRLVFTGQPQPNRGGKGQKHLEFIFYDPGKTESPIPVGEKVMRDFLDIHEEGDEWKFWRSRLNQHLGAPVFYLEEAGFPSAIGLALMFRLPYAHSIGETIAHTRERHRSDGDAARYDLSELLFGTVNDNETGLKGRVSFGMARPASPEHVVSDIPVTILNGPKPSYYPAYVVQNHCDNGHLKTHQYATYMDDGSEIRGWKRYPARPGHGGYRVEHQLAKWNQISNKVKVKLFPLAERSVFKTRVRLHNLRPFELGALVWTLTWGGDSNLRHGLGMGKPFGMGQVTVKINADSWSHLSQNNNEPAPTMEECLNLFASEMDVAFRSAVSAQGDKKVSWLESEQLAHLLAMADPRRAPGQPGSLEYMPLEAFQNNKGRKEQHSSLVLLPYIPFDGCPDRELFLRRPESLWNDQAHEIAAKKEREAALAELPPLLREIRSDLQDSPAPMEQAAKWLNAIDRYEGEERVLVAKELRDFYQKENKWSGKQSTKQIQKIRRLKRALES